MTEKPDKRAVQRQLELIGEHIRILRRSHHFSQVGFAVRAGFAGAYYSAIERGKINFSVANLIRIARGLGVEVGALFPPLSQLTQVGEHEQDLVTPTALAEGEERYTTTIQSNSEIASVQAEGPVTFMSAGAVARLLSVNRRTVERWVREGMLKPAARIEDQRGKLYSVFRREDIDEIAKSRQR